MYLCLPDNNVTALSLSLTRSVLHSHVLQNLQVCASLGIFVIWALHHSTDVFSAQFCCLNQTCLETFTDLNIHSVRWYRKQFSLREFVASFLCLSCCQYYINERTDVGFLLAPVHICPELAEMLACILTDSRTVSFVRFNANA